ncbi:MAG: calcium-translocating P-type ATPase, PMCA-type [Planctomycetaceae bacterium]|nr:calcium-translocating P-type ATPase, PMCA-type [Planctomycetaceae bacterium]
MNLSTIDLSQGLTAEQVKQSREQHGANTLTPPPRDPWWKLLGEKFQDPTIIILLVAAAVSILVALYEFFFMPGTVSSFFDSIGIVCAILLATLAAFFSEMKSAKEFEKLNEVKDDILIKVLRGGEVYEVSIHELVVGDVVLVALGDKVPADGLVTESFGLLIDQAVMTGESVPVEKHGIVCIPEEATDLAAFADDNQIYRGTMVSDGRGRFIVTHVGDRTRLGQIAASLGDAASESDTPLVQKLTHLAGLISKVGMIGAALIFLVMAYFAFTGWTPNWEDGTLNAILPLLKGMLTAFVIAVAIIVVAVPEGLPMMVTIALALNMMKMAKENCLIRKLVASETIGSATVVCTDKTGTLTLNKMTVTWGFAGQQEAASIDQWKHLPDWELLSEALAVNNEATLHILDDGKVEVIGNPTEGALLRLLHDASVDYRDIRTRLPHVWELSHNSARKMSLVAVDREDQRVIYAKGAPERLLKCCSHVQVNGKREPIEQHRVAIDAALVRAQEQALRVIAVTMKTTPAPPREGNDHDLPESFREENAERFVEYRDNTLLALVGISDPIRPEVPDAVRTCHEAGISVRMITGDAKPTAVAIARQAGILMAADDVVLTSEELAELSDEELIAIIPNLKVVARSTPMDKLRLVKAMHRTGEVVAMTGDGTNDAPALKNADVGISMGITGTEVAKEASDVVLIDDNFKSIVTGVRWGRTLYQNIQRFLLFQLTVNVVALTCVFLGPFVGIPLTLTVPQLLWINIIMDTLAAIALCTEPPRAHYMRRKPIKRDASIITPAMGVTILGVGFCQVLILGFVMFSGWFVHPDHAFQYGHEHLRNPDNVEALTVFFTAFVMLTFWNIINSRSLCWSETPFDLLWQNKAFIGIVTFIAVMQITMVQCSGYLGIGEIFRTACLDLWQWFALAAVTVTIIPLAWGVRFGVYKCGLYEEK